MTQQALTRWFPDSAEPKLAPSKVPTPRVAVCLSGGECKVTLRAWTRRGYRALDEADDPRARTGRVAFACALPSCVDLASAGARWWKKKSARNPNFQTEAIAMLKETERTLRALGAPYVILTPGSPTIKKLWKAPSAVISPHHYSGYLPETFEHPSHGQVVPNQDRYHKRTYVFAGNGLVLPRRKPRPPVWKFKRSKKTGKTVKVSPVLAKRKHRAARRLAPLGFMEALAQLHAKELSG